MANLEHLRILCQEGVAVWNKWRGENPGTIPDLSAVTIGIPRHFKRAPAELLWREKFRGANLRKANLIGASLWGVDLVGVDLSFAKLRRCDLRQASLSGANLEYADLHGADLSEANLYGASLGGAFLTFAQLRKTQLFKAKLFSGHLYGADLRDAQLNSANLEGADLVLANLQKTNLEGSNLTEADLSCANLTGARLAGADLARAKVIGACLEQANLTRADLRWADFSGSDLAGCDLRHSVMINTNFADADLTGSRVYGISAWDLDLTDATQLDLIVDLDKHGYITVPDLEVAQFIYLLVNSAKIRRVIDTVTSKVVLILGRFKRMQVLQAISKRLLDADYVPVLFTFEKPESRDFIETVSILAHMARFVVADFTDAKIVLEEVPHIAQSVAVPIVPLLQEGTDPEPTTLYNLRRKHRWILDTHFYRDPEDLLQSFDEAVIAPAEKKRLELEEK